MTKDVSAAKGSPLLALEREREARLSKRGLWGRDAPVPLGARRKIEGLNESSKQSNWKNEIGQETEELPQELAYWRIHD